MLEFRVLGPLEVRRAGEPVLLPGSASRRVLAALLLRATQWTPAHQLIDEAWAGDPPPSARKALQMHVSRLRRSLATAEPGADRALQSGSGGYRLEISPEWIDSVRFERLVEAAHDALAAAEHRRARDLAADGLALWRGPPLEDLLLEGPLAVELGRLEELRIAAMELRVEAELELGCHHEVVDELQKLVAAHPWRERLHAQLMLALYRAGRQAEALDAYRAARSLLVDRLGIEPSPALRELQASILAQDAALGQGLLPRRDALSGAPSPLGLNADPSYPRQPVAGGSDARIKVPLPPTRTIGREDDLDRLRDAVGACRLVTITGAGGVGKTRLAIELAGRVGPALQHGATFVSLGPLTGWEHVAPTIARTLGASPAPGEAVAAAV